VKFQSLKNEFERNLKSKKTQNPSPLSPLLFRTNRPTSLSLSLFLSLRGELGRRPFTRARARARRPPHAAQPALPAGPTVSPSLFFLRLSLAIGARMSRSPPTSSRGSATPSMAFGRYLRVCCASPTFKTLHQAAVKPLFTLPPSINNFPS
jgi:hypothetical protein